MMVISLCMYLRTTPTAPPPKAASEIKMEQQPPKKRPRQLSLDEGEQAGLDDEVPESKHRPGKAEQVGLDDEVPESKHRPGKAEQAVAEEEEPDEVFGPLSAIPLTVRPPLSQQRGPYELTRFPSLSMEVERHILEFIRDPVSSQSSLYHQTIPHTQSLSLAPSSPPFSLFLCNL